MRKDILLTILFGSILIAFFHIIALQFYFYWTVGWYDIPMHIAGGALIGLSGLWIIYLSGIFGTVPRHTFFSIVSVSFFSALIVGILWEMFEVKAGLTSASFVDRIDTVKDIIDDMIGSLLSAWYYVRVVSK